MFLLSNFVLNSIGASKSSSAVATYSIASGLIIYAGIYLYVLFYHQEKLAFLNTILIYVVSIDLLLSGALYNKQVIDDTKRDDEDSDVSSEIDNSEDELVASDESFDSDEEADDEEAEDEEDEEEEVDVVKDELLDVETNQKPNEQ